MFDNPVPLIGTIDFTENVMCVDCHPQQDLIASGCVDGKVFLHFFSKRETIQRRCLRQHKKSCRAVQFSPSGRRLYSSGGDRSLWCVDVETGGIRRKIKPAHECPIYSITITGERFVATGDDNGTVKVWDMRRKESVMTIKECDDFISDMIVDEDMRILLASSGEGTLTSFNIRRRRLEMQSELFNSEMLGLCSVKHQQKLACGSSDGALYLFNWGQWGNMSDRILVGTKGKKAALSLTALVAMDDDVVLAGCSDGCIRAINILPNRVLGIVGIHQFDVDDVALSHDRQVLASCAPADQLVKLWDVTIVNRMVSDGCRKSVKQELSSVRKSDSFFADLIGSSVSDGDDAEDSCDVSDGDDAEDSCDISDSN